MRETVAHHVLNTNHSIMFAARNRQKKRSLAIGLDLGTSQIKAVVLRREGAALQLVEYAVVPSLVPKGKGGAEQQFADELQQLLSRLHHQDRQLSVVVNCNSTMVSEVELPRMPLAEVCGALKLNGSRFLRRDVSQYFLDAIELTPPAADAKAKKNPMMRVLVGGALKEEVTWYRNALALAKIKPAVLELAAVAVVNAFLISQAEICEKETVLLIDVGANQSSIVFLQHGLPVLTRIMHFGGAQISEYLAQVLSLDAKAAEEEKIKMSDPVQALVKTAILPLAKEVRASIDFSERQQERHVTRAFACGGTACAPAMLQLLGECVGLNIEQWNPLQSFDLSQVNEAADELPKLAPSLAAAIGAAGARL